MRIEQVFRQIVFDVIGITDGFQQVYHVLGKAGPIDRLSVGVVIKGSDFVQVNKLMRLANDVQRLLGVKYRLQANPGGDAGGVKLADGSDTVMGQCGTRFPLGRGNRIEKCHSRGVGISVGEQVQVTQRPAAPLGQHLNGDVVCVQDFDGAAGVGQLDIQRLVGVRGEAQQYPVCRVGKLEGVFLELCEKVLAWFGIGKVEAFLERGVGRIAVNAPVVAATIDVARQGGVFSGAASWFIDY